MRRCELPQAGSDHCIPRGTGPVPWVKTGFFDPLFGKPAAKTRPFMQTGKPHPGYFPPVPTRPPAAETARFAPRIMRPKLRNFGFPGPSIPGPVLRRLAGAEPGPGGIPANAKKHENPLKCRNWTPFPLAKARSGSDPLLKPAQARIFPKIPQKIPGIFFTEFFLGLSGTLLEKIF